MSGFVEVVHAHHAGHLVERLVVERERAVLIDPIMRVSAQDGVRAVCKKTRMIEDTHFIQVFHDKRVELFVLAQLIFIHPEADYVVTFELGAEIFMD